jgi:hypothetical protein
MLSTAGSPAALAGPPPVFAIDRDVLSIRAGRETVQCSLRAPVFFIQGEAAIGDLVPLGTTGTLAGDGILETSYPPMRLGDSASLEVKVLLRWSQEESVLRKWARVQLRGEGPRQLNEVILERIDPRGQKVWSHGSGAAGQDSPILLEGPQSHPAFMPGQFVGVEFPVASTRYEAGKIVLAHRPGRKLQPGAWYETRTAVSGLTPIGEEVRSFQSYIAFHRPRPHGCHVNYNSWWTSPVLYTQADIVDLVKRFQQRLYQAHGVAFDTFTIDAGWSSAKSVWEIDAKRLPAGFAPLRAAAAGMHTRLGLWISPSSYYPFALDGDWARAAGFESFAVPNAGDPHTTVRLLCLGGRRYAERFQSRLAELVAHYGIGHVKLDGYAPLCPEAGHGHAPGELSSEAIAEGLIGAVEAARRANPGLWAEPTCFGYNPSPWWLFYVNSVIGSFGDDAPAGRVPSPVYRESYTTARDFFNLQGAALLPVPIAAQEVLGIVHQTAEPFTSDAVITVLRGHQFLPLYVNPQFMNDARWTALAGLLRWARANVRALEETVPLLPRSWQSGQVPRFTDQGDMPREPYGYAHFQGSAGLVALRNPWIARQSYTLKLPGGLGPGPAATLLSAVSLYPEPRIYGENLTPGDTLEVPLAPYETVVLSIAASPVARELSRAASATGRHLTVARCDCRLERVAFRDSGKWLGPDWTCPLGDARSAVHLVLDVKLDLAAPQGELLVLCEGRKPPAAPVGRAKTNGREVEPGTASSATGWSATMLPAHEHWTFLRFPLSGGGNQVVLDQFAADDCEVISAWAWATKPGGRSEYPNSLPQPESISLDGATLVTPAKIAGLARKTAPIERPRERIDGVFLDTVEPVSATQGWGKLQKNQSVWGKPMVIAGRRFLRGLGTHAPSRIEYALDGKFRRFQAWAGADANTWPTVTFEVRLDGVKKWASGLMTRDVPPARVDLDVSGAKRLELVVGDAGDPVGDHADWAEARLLR